MKFQIKSDSLQTYRSDCWVIGLFEKDLSAPLTKKLDHLSQGLLKQLFKKGDFQGKQGQTLLLQKQPSLPAERILLMGLGKEPLSQRTFRKTVFDAIQKVSATAAKNAVLFLTDLPVDHYNTDWNIKQMVEVSYAALYQFQHYKTKKLPLLSLKSITLHLEDKKKLKTANQALKEGEATALGVEFTKNLANQPSNVCTPSYLALEAKKLAKQFKTIKTKILEESAMRKLGMGAFLAVAKGSIQDAKLVSLEYKGTSKKTKTIALVGKGITFDTGGISLKPAEGMVGMKYDMCGAATVLGVMKAAALLKLPLHIVGILATAENMPSGGAAKPEDIVTSLSGQTIEIMNTDAEGRLVLCDALTYCERFKPDTVIDIATLTGAVVIALGHHASGLLSNQDALAEELLTAGKESFDRAWQMPLWEEYQEQLRSPFADMSNVGGRAAGTITAACFLSRFAKKFHWAHLDVAGTAAMMGGGPDRYATGRPVPLLTQFLINRCRK